MPTETQTKLHNNQLIVDCDRHQGGWGLIVGRALSINYWFFEEKLDVLAAREWAWEVRRRGTYESPLPMSMGLVYIKWVAYWSHWNSAIVHYSVRWYNRNTVELGPMHIIETVLCHIDHTSTRVWSESLLTRLTRLKSILVVVRSLYWSVFQALGC